MMSNGIKTGYTAGGGLVLRGNNEGLELLGYPAETTIFSPKENFLNTDMNYKVQTLHHQASF